MILATENSISGAQRVDEVSMAQAIDAVVDCLNQLASFMKNLTDEQYTCRPPTGSSSVGSHARHCLDHVEALLRGVADGVVDYDNRQRGTDDERCRSAALRRVAELRVSLQQALLERERYLCVRSMVTPDGGSVRVHSSWGRELVFVLSHTIHHQAMMAAAAQALGAAVDRRFGCAPSTLAYRDQTPCVRSA